MSEKISPQCTDLRESAWTYLTDDGIVSFRPSRLEGVIVNASSAGGSVTLYAGEDATAGRIIGTFKALNTVSMVQNIIPPLPCPDGIYAVLDANCENVTVFWSVIGKAEEQVPLAKLE